MLTQSLSIVELKLLTSFLTCRLESLMVCMDVPHQFQPSELNELESQLHTITVFLQKVTIGAPVTVQETHCVLGIVRDHAGVLRSACDKFHFYDNKLEYLIHFNEHKLFTGIMMKLRSEVARIKVMELAGPSLAYARQKIATITQMRSK